MVLRRRTREKCFFFVFLPLLPLSRCLGGHELRADSAAYDMLCQVSLLGLHYCIVSAWSRGGMLSGAPPRRAIFLVLRSLFVSWVYHSRAII